MKIGLLDLEFEHVAPPNSYHDHAKPQHIEWDRETPEENEVVVFTERCYDEVMNEKYTDCIKIAWPLEPPVIHKYAYKNLMAGLHKEFDYVLTFDNGFHDWLYQNSSAQPIWWTPAGGWIFKEDHKIYKKTKTVQMIASTKDWTDGHRLRHEVARKHSLIHKYGHAYKPFDYTLDVFRDYRFAIVIENCILHDYFTDKLTSAFYTGTVPVMWNDGFIKKYFNPDGMILWQDINELGRILDNLTEARYLNMMPAIVDNFERAKELFCPEDVIYEESFKNFDTE